MPKMRPLYRWIGDPVMLIEPDAYTSAARTCSNHDGLALVDVDTVLVILAVGDGTTVAGETIALYYSCDAEGSNANATSSIWHSTDATFAAVDSDGVNEVYLLELDVNAKGLPNEAGGYLFAAQTAEAPVDALDLCVIAIPTYQTFRYPATNANTVVYSKTAPSA